MIDLASNDSLLARFARDLDGQAITAPISIDVPHADREVARVAWAHRIVDEYRSVAVFGELLVLLANLEAPYPALCAVQRLIGDELRHARLCAAAVDWLGGTEELDVDLSHLALPPRRAGESSGRRAAEIIARELVVAEEESIVVLAACRDAATEPAFRAVLATLLRDEVRHAAAGRALYRLFDEGAALARTITDADHAELAAVMAADRAELREVYRAAARGGPGRTLGASITTRDLFP
ncbi:MAG: ferritin-like domain-containing protein [Deltaproteobacteria bacterium]|nr:ferritin-like domain-containing protein [Deltaproteobacteria bacterium]